MSAVVSASQKAHVARCQLGTALHLYLTEMDPVSVHVLACGGLEVAEALAQSAGGQPFSAFALEVHQDLTQYDLKRVRNQAWNAMKHATDKKGRERDDEALLAGRWPEDNEAILGEAWFNLSQAGIPLPIEAQVFNLWILARHGDPGEISAEIKELFPNAPNLSTAEALRSIRHAIAVAREHTDVMASPLTDPRPLIIPSDLTPVSPRSL